VKEKMKKHKVVDEADKNEAEGKNEAEPEAEPEADKNEAEDKNGIGQHDFDNDKVD